MLLNSCFDQHISTLCKKASNRLNARREFWGKKSALELFVLSNFNYCLILGHFWISKSLKKYTKYKSGYLEFYKTTLPVIIPNF